MRLKSERPKIAFFAEVLKMVGGVVKVVEVVGVVGVGEVVLNLLLLAI